MHPLPRRAGAAADGVTVTPMRGATNLLADVGLPADEIGLTIVAGPLVLAATFPIEARAAAALDACGVAAALLWRDTTRQDQAVEGDARRADASS